MSKKSDNKSVLVVGATGYLGMEICRQLSAAGKKVKALIRNTSDPAKIKALQGSGVETVLGDLKQPTSLSKAVKGVNAVISTASSTLSRQENDSIESVDNQGQLNLVQAAVEGGVKKFIFISFFPMKQQFPLQSAKRHVEKKIMESGMEYTILQPGFFMELWMSPFVGFDFPNSKVVLYGEGKNKLSWISLVDVAAFAVASLENKALSNSVVKLGGPEALSPLEVVRIFEKHTGNRFVVEHVPTEALQAQMTEAMDPMSESMAGLMMSYAEGDGIDMNETRKLFPFRLTSVADFVQRIPVGHEI